MANKTLHNKKRLLQSLENHLGIVSAACKECGLSRTTYYDYYKKDKKFRAAVDELADVALDFAETSLFKQIKDGNPTSTIFYLKTKGRNKRGYVEKQEVEHSGGVESTLIQWKPAEEK
ncbi:MAG: hypothetical protein Tp166DCM644871_16 [Prokaryotic dsDNA virus sp.]|nr:MAG: hypothetical protein Tp166DCM644871_16 [Prokaryotic dsDNA virus sp.]QDP62616.1 MAG: hypothetical protein Tp166SUR375021_16 [Prokaryotic dsDNA virus sp.]|tara:strand:- start:111 stop:464 length:354 start_codon:yes stop_codon:yes gene_type:complete